MPERLNDILHSIACRAAIKAHDGSLLPELKRLMEQLLADPSLRNCPHGRPVYLEITRHEHAIPQYDKKTPLREKAYKGIEQAYPGILMGGNGIDGIGMAKRVAQGRALAERIR